MHRASRVNQHWLLLATVIVVLLLLSFLQSSQTAVHQHLGELHPGASNSNSHPLKTKAAGALLEGYEPLPSQGPSAKVTNGTTRKVLQNTPGSDGLTFNTIDIWEQASLGNQTVHHQKLVWINHTEDVSTGRMIFRGWIPKSTDPHPSAISWLGTRHRTVLQCSSNISALVITASNVVFEGLQLQGCSATELAAVLVESTAKNVSFVNCVFIANNPGGAIETYPLSSLLLKDVIIQQHAMKDTSSTVSTNSYRGAGVNIHGELVVENSVFHNNTADTTGPTSGSVAIAAGGWLLATNSTFTGNSGGIGGGVSVGDLGGAANATFISCTFQSNECSSNGGGCGLLLQNASTVQVKDTSFINHNNSGSAVMAMDGAQLHMSNCSMVNNTAINGAGVMLTGSILWASSCVFHNNVASGGGGAIAAYHGSRVDVYNSTFDMNSGNVGGGLQLGTNGQTVPSLANVSGCTFHGNTGAYGGGAMWIETSSSLEVIDTYFLRQSISNRWDGGGGAAVYVTLQAQALVDNCTFDSNVTPEGGAMLLTETAAASTIRNSIFLDNVCAGAGCGLLARCNISVSNTSFRGNEVLNKRELGGGAAVKIHLLQQLSVGNLFFTCDYCTFQDNKAQKGAGLWVQGREYNPQNFIINVTLSNCQFISNTAMNASQFSATQDFPGGSVGGAIAVSHQIRLQLNDCLFESNIAMDMGGAIIANYSSNIISKNTSFHKNRAVGFEGGAIFIHRGSSLQAFNTTFQSNYAGLGGGAISVGEGTVMSAERCSFLNNTAEKDGGAIAMYRTALQLNTIYNSQFLHNTANRGGVMRVAGSQGDVEFFNTSFVGNVALSTGGALWLEGYVPYHSRDACRAKVITCQFDANEAPIGGAITVSDRADAVVINSSFTGNTASLNGGAIAVDYAGNLTLTGSTLEGNKAVNYGGGIALLSNSTAVLDNSTFLRNGAQIGGSVAQLDAIGRLAVTSCTFTNNSAELQGGAIAAAAQLNILNSTMQGNRAQQEGGALHLFDSVSAAAVRQSIFANNSATEDGANGVTGRGAGGSLFSAAVNASFEQCVFTHDQAQQGGSIYIDSGYTSLYASQVLGSTALGGGGGGIMVAASGRISVLDCRLEYCWATEGGAAMIAGIADFTDQASSEGTRRRHLKQSAGDNNKLVGCYLVGNNAQRGGAVLVEDEGAVNMTRCQIRGNQASLVGGAMAVRQKGSLQLNACKVVDNTAGGHGGGLHSFGSTSLMSTVLEGNSAAGSGGAAACETCQSLVVHNLVAERNTAKKAGGGLWVQPQGAVEIVGARLLSNTAAQGGGGFFTSTACNSGQNTGPCISISNMTITNNTALNTTVTQPTIDASEGQGGGLYIQAAQGLVQLENITAQENRAQLGAGLFVDTVQCTSQGSSTATACVVMSHTDIHNNVLSQGGSKGVYGTDVFASKPDAVGVACNGVNSTASLLYVMTTMATMDSSTSGGCFREDLGFSNETVSSAAHSLLVEPAWPAIPGEIASRETLEVTLRVLDMYGQPVRLSSSREVDFQVNMSGISSGVQLLGTTLVQGSLEAGAKFPSIKLLSQPSSYRLQFSTRRDDLGLAPQILDVRVRECYSGEAEGVLECIDCGRSDQFSLTLRSTECSRCAVGGNCSTGLMFPKSGYWQSHPRSPQLHACLHEATCRRSREGVRDRELYRLQARYRHLPASNISMVDMDLYQQAQCAKGHTGNLCATCQEGYGRNGAYCTKCTMTRAGAAIGLIAILFAQALIIACHMAVFNMGVRHAHGIWQSVTRHVATSPSQRTDPAFGERVLQPEGTPAAGGGGVSPETLTAMSSATFTGNPCVENLTAPVPGPGQGSSSARVHYPDDMQPHHISASTFQAGQTADELLSQQLTEKASGALKILLEFVQLLGILRSVRLPMPLNVRDFFNALDVTSASNGQVLYCSLLGTPSTRLIVTAVFSVAVPLAFCAAAVPLLAALDIIRRWRTGSHAQHAFKDLPRNCFVFAVLTYLFFFPNICRQLLLALTFIRLDYPQPKLPAGSVLAAKGWYWLQLPDMKYFQGAHRVLVLALGIPGLLLFALLVPWGLALMVVRQHQQLANPSVRAWYGMLYNDYVPACYYWQSVVLTAQLLLIMCAVLLNSVGTTVQLLAAMVVIAAYQYVTTLAQPNKHTALVHLSRTMLLAVSLTLLLLLYLAVVQRDSHRLAVIVLLLVLNTSVVLLLLGYIAYIITKLWPLLKKKGMAWSVVLSRSIMRKSRHQEPFV